MIHPSDRQTDGRTHNSIYAVARKKDWINKMTDNNTRVDKNDCYYYTKINGRTIN